MIESLKQKSSNKRLTEIKNAHLFTGNKKQYLVSKFIDKIQSKAEESKDNKILKFNEQMIKNLSNKQKFNNSLRNKK